MPTGASASGHDTGTTCEIVNVIYGTNATGPTVGNYPVGTIYLTYT
jgi:hypothetical protein